MFSPTEKFAIFGVSGCGKSTLQEKITSCYPRRVIIDRMREHRDGYITNSFEDFANFLSRAISTNQNSFKLVLQFDTEARSEKQELIFDHALRLAYKFGEVSGKGICVSVEEVHEFATPHYVPHWLRETTLTGRHVGMAIAISSQFPALVPKTLVGQGHVFVGQLFERNAIEYLRHTIGDVAFQAKNLPTGSFLHYYRGQTRIVDNGFSSSAAREQT